MMEGESSLSLPIDYGEDGAPKQVNELVPQDRFPAFSSSEAINTRIMNF